MDEEVLIQSSHVVGDRKLGRVERTEREGNGLGMVKQSSVGASLVSVADRVSVEEDRNCLG